MSDNENCSSDREKSPSFMWSNDDLEQRSKKVSPKAREPLKEHPKRKRAKSRSKSSSDRSTDEERSDQKNRRNDIDLEVRETKRKNIGDIHLCYHHRAHLMAIPDESKYRNSAVK